MKRFWIIACLPVILIFLNTHKGFSQNTSVIPGEAGWAQNSVNTVIFRSHALVTHQNTQYAAFYNSDTNVVLAKRPLNSDDWQVKVTRFQGNVEDAHNSISIAVDGDGYLHMAWDHHDSPLRYCKSTAPGSLQMSDEMEMTGTHEQKVTYPQFYHLPDGNLIFMYRDGSSGRGNLVINKYQTSSCSWNRLHQNLIDGEGERNAYWQAFVDVNGTIHLSWVWRETWDVATNHDLCYARSTDGGDTWERSDGNGYTLPITDASAEYAVEIPQNSELINQTAMHANRQGRPYIVSYWDQEEGKGLQYRVVYKEDSEWKMSQATNRAGSFSLSGGGTKRIPISRPEIIVKHSNGSDEVYIIYRDRSRGNYVSVTYSKDESLNKWKTRNISQNKVGQWEPNYDKALWKKQQQLQLFLQKTGQGDSESLEDMPPQPVKVLEVGFEGFE